jgi:membrane protein YqaA with SNARE-associated domain
MQEKVKSAVATNTFQTGYKILGILFIILTYFISVSPDAFLKFGYLGVFLFNIVSSGLVIMPVLTEKFNVAGVIFFSALGNILNTSVNYFIGATSTTLFSGNQIVGKLKKFVDRFGLFAVFILAILPMPLDVNGLLSGYMGVDYKKYIAVNFLGKVVVFALAGLGVITFSEVTKQ